MGQTIEHLVQTCACIYSVGKSPSDALGHDDSIALDTRATCCGDMVLTRSGHVAEVKSTYSLAYKRELITRLDRDLVGPICYSSLLLRIIRRPLAYAEKSRQMIGSHGWNY